MDFEENPLDEERPFAGGIRKISKSQIIDLAEKLKPHFLLLEQFQALFYEIPDLTARQVDDRVKVMYETLMEVCSRVGIHRISIPQLKECCGKKRVWKDERPWFRLGDTIAWITTKLGFRPCEECKQRQETLNRVRWPWSK